MNDHDLMKLASQVMGQIGHNQGDTESYEDCWQTAYTAGLQALRNTEARRQKPSSRYLKLCMRQSVYRLLQRKKVATYEKPPEVTDKTDDLASIDAADFVNRHLSSLTEKQANLLVAFFTGQTAQQIAAREGVTYDWIHKRIKRALKELRENSGQN